MYTDNSMLTTGKYKYISLCRVPPEYLLEIFKNKKHPNKELLEYIENNMEKIKGRLIGEIPIPELVLPCEKIMYPSEKAAKTEIRRIEKLEQENKKPVRAYECEKCGAWHLTSIPFEKWEKKKDKD
jgi:hypothetical protein